jgi:Plasma-membrane choline transporter
MTTAITAIKANFGVTVFAYFFTLLAAVWSLVWSVAVAGTQEKTYNCDEGTGTCSPNYGLIFLLFLSFFFAHQVIQNSVHVTVAGVVGNWWVAPAENGFCGRAVCSSFCRTITTSFGSICFGVSSISRSSLTIDSNQIRHLTVFTVGSL